MSAIFCRIAKRRQLEIVIGRAPNKKVFRRSIGNACDCLRDALAWLADKVPDAAALLAECAPELIDRATAVALADKEPAPAKGDGWTVYGHIAVIRPTSAGYTLTLGVHGAATNIAGIHRTVQEARAVAIDKGAAYVIGCAVGENAGDRFFALPKGDNGLRPEYSQTDMFAALVRARSGQPGRGPNAANGGT